MSGVGFTAQWLAAPGVSSPELAATWARFAVDVAGTPATLVREVGATGEADYRGAIFVSPYPLAEWMAYNWWALTTPHRGGVLRFDSAGDGFAWPPLQLEPQPGGFVATQRPRLDSLQRVEYVARVYTFVDRDDTLYSLGRFVDSVVQRLESEGIEGTPLQDEWDAILATSDEEERFCRAAASLGLDPWNIGDGEFETVAQALESVGALAPEVLAASNHKTATEAVAWVAAGLSALNTIELRTSPVEALRSAAQPDIHERSFELDARTPWRIGFARARSLRERLGLDATDGFDLSDIVGLEEVAAPAPGIIEGVGRVGRDVRIAVPEARPEAGRRLLQVRALSRALFDTDGPQLITKGTSVRDRIERAFAVETLAPASGIAELLRGDYSESAQLRAADHFGVDQLVVAHQIENQLLRAS